MHCALQCYQMSRNSYPKNLQARGKSQGWAAFDMKQRPKQQQQGHQKQPQVVVGNGNDDPFPPLPTTATSSETTTTTTCGINAVPTSVRSFSSVFLPSGDFPPISDNLSDPFYNKLKQLYPCADPTLIRDVLYSVNNDIPMAATFLNDILSCSSSSTHNSSNGNAHTNNNYIPTFHEIQSEDVQNERSFSDNVSSDLAADISDLSSTLGDALSHNNPNQLEAACGQGEGLSEVQAATAAAAANMKLILGHLKSIPVGPEWEDHDVYSRHRRNALKIIRLASRHSRAATNAFMRGDHFSAQQESLKARKVWLDAERLNVEAAKEIMKIRNSGNNPWKLDLHGLHAAEAVQALQEHLKKIETQLSMKQSVSRGRVKTKNGIACSDHSSIELLSSTDVENLDVPCMGFRQRPASLQVITGVGNHSRGQAALPTAVKSFLNENRYHFDEVRPGVIVVFPKFCHR